MDEACFLKVLLCIIDSLIMDVISCIMFDSWCLMSLSSPIRHTREFLFLDIISTESSSPSSPS
jgi:hypothetical protein